MIIGSIGREIIHEQVKTIDLVSMQTLLDFDALFIFGPEIGPIENPRAFSDRRSQILEFLQLGRIVVVFTCVGNIRDLLPVSDLKMQPSSGRRVEFKGPDYLRTFWATIQNDMQYLAYFEKPPGQPFLFVAETNKALATLMKIERGYVLFLPWLNLAQCLHSVYEQKCKRFVAAFQKLAEHVSPRKTTISFPPWSIHYGWQSERELRDKLVSTQRQADDLSKTITAKSKQLEAEERLKILFTAKGDDLADAVTEVFQGLGAKAETGEPGRDDIIIEFEGKHAVVEVKGRNGSAAEKDVAQLQKWVSISLADREIDAKGILLVNAFCDTPVVARVEQAFPDQMLKLAKKYEHCLLTTTQLLGLLLEARAHPEKRVELVNSLFSTIGVYQQFSDWWTFLTAPVAATAKS
jgi:hypothetical protein